MRESYKLFRQIIESGEWNPEAEQYLLKSWWKDRKERNRKVMTKHLMELAKAMAERPYPEEKYDGWYPCRMSAYILRYRSAKWTYSPLNQIFAVRMLSQKRNKNIVEKKKIDDKFRVIRVNFDLLLVEMQKAMTMLESNRPRNAVAAGASSG
jgi:hypothetical protein